MQGVETKRLAESAGAQAVTGTVKFAGVILNADADGATLILYKGTDATGDIIIELEAAEQITLPYWLPAGLVEIAPGGIYYSLVDASGTSTADLKFIA